MKCVPLAALCVLLWTDSFPVAGPQRAWQEVKVELCDTEWTGPRVEVSVRVLWDVETAGEPERAVLADWKMIRWESVKPSKEVSP